MIRIFRKKCPRCPDGRLKNRNWIRATCVNETGQRYPDSWTYYECDRCDARLKVFINGRIADATNKEWLEHCTNE